MPNQDLLKYIQDSFAQNVSKEEIKRAVLEVGWAEADIATAFLVAEGGIAPVVQPEEPAPILKQEPTPVVVQTPQYSAPSFAQPAEVNSEPINFASSMEPKSMPMQAMPSAPSNSQPASMAQPSPHHGTLLWVMGTIIVALLVAGGIVIWVVMNNKGTVVHDKVMSGDAVKTSETPVVVSEGNNATSNGVVVKPSTTIVTQKPTTTYTETADWKLYKNELYGLSFKYPKDWGEPPYSPKGDRRILGYGDRLNTGVPADNSLLTAFVEKYHFEGILITASLDEGFTLDYHVKQLGLIDTKTLTVGGAQAIQGKRIIDLGSMSMDSYYTLIKHGPFVYEFRNKTSESFLVGGATSKSAQDIHNKILSTVKFF